MKWRGAAWLVAAFLSPAAALRAGRTATADGEQARVREVLRAERERTRALASANPELRRALRLQLLQVPVPPEVRSAALAAASGVAGVNAATVDESTTAINAMLRDARWQLDQTLMECRTLPEQLRAQAAAATAEVQGAAMGLGQERAEVEKSAMEIPVQSEWFQTLSFSAKLGRRDCEAGRWERKAHARALRADAQRFRHTRDALAAKCAGSSGLQLLSSSVPCANSTRAGSGAKASAAKLPAWSRRLRPAARRRLRPILLQLDSLASPVIPPSCKYERRACPELLRGLDEVLGEVADGRARLRFMGEQSERDCARQRRFEEGELRTASERRQDYSKQLARATGKMNIFGREGHLEESRRMALEDRLMAAKTRCQRKVDDLLHGQICGLRNVRDQLWLLQGRSELPEDCEVTDWRDGPCSSSCGHGTRVSFREVVSPAWGGGVECPPLRMTRPCGEPRCPQSCVVSLWSGWSACSARCGTGVQQRTRSALTQASNGGDACPNLVDVRTCNAEACSKDCVLDPWSSWSPCSRACGGGARLRHRAVAQPASDGGQCPASDAEERLESMTCNSFPCAQGADLKCAGTPLDVILVVEASGSSASTFEGLKALATELVNRFAPHAGGTQVGIVAFSSVASLVSGLSLDRFSLQQQISQQLVSPREGPCMLSSGLAAASNALLNGGRREAVSTVLVLTAGRPADPFLASQAAAQLQRHAARILVVAAGVESAAGGAGGDAVAPLGRLATPPVQENIISVPSVHALQANTSDIALRVISSACSQLAEG